jgi:hypothetical protein
MVPTEPFIFFLVSVFFFLKRWENWMNLKEEISKEKKE